MQLKQFINARVCISVFINDIVVVSYLVRYFLHNNRVIVMILLCSYQDKVRGVQMGNVVQILQVCLRLE